MDGSLWAAINKIVTLRTRSRDDDFVGLLHHHYTSKILIILAMFNFGYAFAIEMIQENPFPKFGDTKLAKSEINNKMKNLRFLIKS